MYFPAPWGYFASEKLPKGFRGVTVSKQDIFVFGQRTNTYFFYKWINKAFSWQFDAANALICGQCYEGYDGGVTVGLRSCSPQNLQHLVRAKIDKHLERLILPGINYKKTILTDWFHWCTVQICGKIILGGG